LDLELGENMVKYTKKVQKLKVYLKWNNFKHKYKIVDSKYNQASLWNDFSSLNFLYFDHKNWIFWIIKVDNKYFWNWLVNMVLKKYFFIKKNLMKQI
jgi:hypothetical protein